MDWADNLVCFGDDDQDPKDDDDDEVLPDAGTLPECDATFPDLDSLNVADGSTLNSFKAVYMMFLPAPHGRNNAYDKDFKMYANVAAKSAGKVMRGSINRNGNDYFSCVVSELSLCCFGCKSQNGKDVGDPCTNYFSGDCYITEIVGHCWAPTISST
ncbi:hypothetical protein DBV05_g8733 [Lasiodiplodia theobromae]|uniref:Uncharacterized protein n=1 Tax=Lasiodiplodia theobromae TaxID=45133 RepID=A0A5N5D4P3_9PEZI|nr:hypothetical protein DBV05_g8733 [Lasiodiplodia theobromae]